MALHRRRAGLERGRLVERAYPAARARQAGGAGARLRGAHGPLEGHLRPPQLDRRQGAGAGSYTRFDKVAWGQPVKTNGWAPDARWYGHSPALVGAVEGPAAEALIPKIRAAVARYPYSHSGDYSVWPGPNSNSFTAYVLAAIPEAGIALPPTAVGKDWRVDSRIFGLTPSGTGVQLSLGGLLGITVGWVEGVEVNVLGLVAGIDFRRPALKLPGLGRFGIGTVA